MNEQDRFRTVNRDFDYNKSNCVSPQLDKFRKKRSSIVFMIVAGILVTAILVIAIYSYLVSPVDELIGRIAVKQNYTFEIIAKHHAYKVSSTFNVDGNVMYIKLYNGEDLYCEFIDESVYIYEKWSGERYIRKKHGDYDDIKEDAASEIDADVLFDSDNYRPQILNPFSWRMKDDVVTGKFHDVKIRRVFGNIVVKASSDDFEYKIKFKNIGSTKVELPETEDFLK